MIFRKLELVFFWGLALLAGAAVTFLLSWPPYTIIEVRLSRRLNQMFTPGERNLPSGG